MSLEGIAMGYVIAFLASLIIIASTWVIKTLKEEPNGGDDHG